MGGHRLSRHQNNNNYSKWTLGGRTSDLKSSNLQIYKSSNLQIYKSTNLQIYKMEIHQRRKEETIKASSIRVQVYPSNEYKYRNEVHYPPEYNDTVQNRVPSVHRPAPPPVPWPGG